jgi:hypothetical protein
MDHQITEKTSAPDRDPFEQASKILVSALVAALFSGVSILMFVGITAVLAEGANWLLSFTNVSLRISWGLMSALLSPVVVYMALAASPDALPNKRFSNWVTVVLVSLALVVLAFFVKGVRNLEYSLLLGAVLFLFSYAEILGLVRSTSKWHA